MSPPTLPSISRSSGVPPTPVSSLPRVEIEHAARWSPARAALPKNGICSNRLPLEIPHPTAEGCGQSAAAPGWGGSAMWGQGDGMETMGGEARACGGRDRHGERGSWEAAVLRDSN
jgi:hypothetical protein